MFFGEGLVYHIPNMYLSRVAQTVADWVIFFEGRRGGSRGYYAVQRVSHIVPDRADELHKPNIPPWPGMAEAQQPYKMPEPDDIRPMVLSSRAFRDRSFARQVKRAYAARCAMSGLSLRNGGGRPEVEAAHILPVEENGPDTVRNGLALSGTVHWMFDRGLVSVDHDGTILIAQGSIASEVADRLLVPDRRLIVPAGPALRPHQGYLEWHRQHRFKG